MPRATRMLVTREDKNRSAGDLIKDAIKTYLDTVTRLNKGKRPDVCT